MISGLRGQTAALWSSLTVRPGELFLRGGCFLEGFCLFCEGFRRQKLL